MWRCAVIQGVGQPLMLTTRPVPRVPPEGVLVKTTAAGVCHSDLHYLADEPGEDGENVRYYLGDDFIKVVMGHEIAGVISAIGDEAHNSGLTVGDHVVVCPWTGCRSCDACRVGDTNLCENNPCGIKDIGQGLNPGGYGTYVPVSHWSLVVKFPDHIKPEVACMLPCSALTTYRATKTLRESIGRAFKAKGQSWVLIIGAGGLGLWAINHTRGFFRDFNVKVIVLDINQEKLNVAKDSGADDVILNSANDNLDDVINRVTQSKSRCVSGVMDFVGTQETATIATRVLNKGGTAVFVGLMGGVLSHQITSLISRSITVKGVRTGSCTDLIEMMNMLKTSSFKAPPITLVTLDDINTVLKNLDKGFYKGRAVVKYDLTINSTVTELTI